ncbi:hypothetical protein [Microvirgula aerodenitrificans]|uniref:hypothetical protein n=1 Tax=Microvirgula aerodenitrificans TaxID=57480 RepID=UPI00131F2AE3|nr:hypothetical protein [Microvirgula aerodenitrificans]
MKNKAPEVISKQDAEALFESAQPEIICQALVSLAFYEQDWKWVQDKCLFFIQEKNPSVRRVAATCLGHVARIHGRLEKDKVVKKLRLHMSDHESIGSIEGALDDIEMFAKR